MTKFLIGVAATIGGLVGLAHYDYSGRTCVERTDRAFISGEIMVYERCTLRSGMTGNDKPLRLANSAEQLAYYLATNS